MSDFERFEFIFQNWVLIVVALVVVKIYSDRKQTLFRITATEIILIGLVNIFLVPMILDWGVNVSIDNLTTFNEKWNGSLTGYSVQEITCERDGLCQHTYQCDRYQCGEDCTCTSRDKEGRCTSQSCSPVYCYHDCPYCTEEYTFRLHSNLGDFTIAANWLPENPDNYRWRLNQRVPSNLPSGIPAFWQLYADRLDLRISDPVTQQHEYSNFLLANDETVLREVSGDIEYYQEAGLMPRFNSPVTDFFLADKAYFVGYQPENASEWQTATAGFNAVFGPELQGDLYLVVTNDARINTDPLRFVRALKAYWQDRHVFGRDTLAKNSVLVVVGTNGETLTWVEATTGMPYGNERMLNEFFRRADRNTGTIPFTPEAVIGTPSITMRGNPNGNHTALEYVHTNGFIEDIVFGLSDQTLQFARETMSGGDEDDNGLGLEYMRLQVKIEGWQKLLISIGFIFFGAIEIIAMVAVHINVPIIGETFSAIGEVIGSFISSRRDPRKSKDDE